MPANLGKARFILRKSERIWRSIMRGEHLLLWLVMVTSVLLLAAQILLFRDDMRPYFSRMDFLEGQPLQGEKNPGKIFSAVENAVNNRQILRKSKTIIIHMIHPAQSPKAVVTVNGQMVGDFRKGYLEVLVYNGDFVEIDGAGLWEKAEYVVNTEAPELKNMNGLLLESQHSIVTLGKIKFAMSN